MIGHHTTAQIGQEGLLTDKYRITYIPADQLRDLVERIQVTNDATAIARELTFFLQAHGKELVELIIEEIKNELISSYKFYQEIRSLWGDEREE